MKSLLIASRICQHYKDQSPFPRQIPIPLEACSKRESFPNHFLLGDSFLPCSMAYCFSLGLVPFSRHMEKKKKIHNYITMDSAVMTSKKNQ